MALAPVSCSGFDIPKCEACLCNVNYSSISQASLCSLVYIQESEMIAFLSGSVPEETECIRFGCDLKIVLSGLCSFC